MVQLDALGGVFFDSLPLETAVSCTCGELREKYLAATPGGLLSSSSLIWLCFKSASVRTRHAVMYRFREGWYQEHSVRVDVVIRLESGWYIWPGQRR